MPSGGTGARTTLVFRRDQVERPTDEKPIGLLRRFAATPARITLAGQDRAFARPNAGLGYLRRITNASKSRQSRDSKVPTVQTSLPPPTSLHIRLHLWRGQKTRAKCGGLSPATHPERATSRRIRPIRRAFSPCEIRTVRFSGLECAPENDPCQIDRAEKTDLT